MATHVFAGNAARGMSLIALHNGGGVGTSKSVNGGYGLVLDGSKETDEIIKKAVLFDVMAGVARRSWANLENAKSTSIEFNTKDEGYITIPFDSEEEKLKKIIKSKYKQGGY